LTNRSVALVHYGERNTALSAALRSRGARLDEVCPYEWALPEDLAPLDPESPIAGWSMAYLHHLTKSGEMLGAMLLTQHNLWFYQQVMAGLRAAIAEQSLAEWAADFRRRYNGGRAQ